MLLTQCEAASRPTLSSVEHQSFAESRPDDLPAAALAFSVDPLAALLYGVGGQLTSFLEDPHIVCFVEVAACQVKSLLPCDVNLLRNKVVSRFLASSEPELTDLGAFDSHHGSIVVATLYNLCIQLLGDRPR